MGHTVPVNSRSHIVGTTAPQRFIYTYATVQDGFTIKPVNIPNHPPRRKPGRKPGVVDLQVMVSIKREIASE